MTINLELFNQKIEEVAIEIPSEDTTKSHIFNYMWTLSDIEDINFSKINSTAIAEIIGDFYSVVDFFSETSEQYVLHEHHPMTLMVPIIDIMKAMERIPRTKEKSPYRFI